MEERTQASAANLLLDGGSNQRTSPTDPLVSVVMPVLNEGQTIRRAIESVLSQTYPSSRLEILVVVGGSTDNTCDVVRKLMSRCDRIELIESKHLNCLAAMNAGIQRSRGDFVAKVDGYGYLEKDFIKKAVGILCSDISIAYMGGDIVPDGLVSLIQKSNAYARGRGAWRDNVFVECLWRSVKYEEVYLHAYDSVAEARAGLARYFQFYNSRLPHSSLADQTPDHVYFHSQSQHREVASHLLNEDEVFKETGTPLNTFWCTR